MCMSTLPRSDPEVSGLSVRKYIPASQNFQTPHHRSLGHWVGEHIRGIVPTASLEELEPLTPDARGRPVSKIRHVANANGGLRAKALAKVSGSRFDPFVPLNAPLVVCNPASANGNATVVWVDDQCI